MSIVLVRQALQAALASISPPIGTSWENEVYRDADGNEAAPTEGTPYQAVFLITAQPENVEIGSAYTERGYLQINLNYPLDEGSIPAATRAELIRAAFARGASFEADGVTVNIEQTPEIGPGRTEDNVYFLPVKARFYAHVRS